MKKAAHSSRKNSIKQLKSIIYIQKNKIHTQYIENLDLRIVLQNTKRDLKDYKEDLERIQGACDGTEKVYRILEEENSILKKERSDLKNQIVKLQKENLQLKKKLNMNK